MRGAKKALRSGRRINGGNLLTTLRGTRFAPSVLLLLLLLLGLAWLSLLPRLSSVGDVCSICALRVDFDMEFFPGVQKRRGCHARLPRALQAHEESSKLEKTLDSRLMRQVGFHSSQCCKSCVCGDRCSQRWRVQICRGGA